MGFHRGVVGAEGVHVLFVVGLDDGQAPHATGIGNRSEDDSDALVQQALPVFDVLAVSSGRYAGVSAAAARQARMAAQPSLYAPPL